MTRRLSRAKRNVAARRRRLAKRLAAIDAEMKRTYLKMLGRAALAPNAVVAGIWRDGAGMIDGIRRVVGRAVPS